MLVTARRDQRPREGREVRTVSDALVWTACALVMLFMWFDAFDPDSAVDYIAMECRLTRLRRNSLR